MNALRLSRGDIEKMLQAFPQQSAKAERPLGNILFRRRQYSAHTQTRTYKLQFFFLLYGRGIFVLYFSLVAAAHIFIQRDDIILKDCNFESES